VSTQRTLAVVAAVLTIFAVALGTFEVHPPELGDLLAGIDRGLPDRVRSGIGHVLGHWAEAALINPLLQRPAWLSPAALALLTTGLALSVSGRKTSNRSRRRS
jgi:hypothetical protein